MSETAVFSTKQKDQERAAAIIEIGDRKFVCRKRTVAVMDEFSKIEDKQNKLKADNRERADKGEPVKRDPHPYADIVFLLEPADDGGPATNKLLEDELDTWEAGELREALFPEWAELGKALVAAADQTTSTSNSEDSPPS